MVKTKHIGLEKDSMVELVKELDRCASVYNVFATQTAFPVVNGKIKYIAVAWYRQDE